MMLTLTDATFQKEVLESKEPVLVDFWAPWCGPCKLMGPVIEELAADFAGKPVKIAKMDVDTNDITPPKYGVMSIPTLIFFQNGKPVDQLIGVQKKEDLKKRIEGAMK
ncbi:MAG: thioredoxin [bacterium]|nr:thioredoxin [bacterium]